MDKINKITFVNTYLNEIYNTIYYKSLVENNNKIYNMYHKKYYSSKLNSKIKLILIWGSVLPKIIFNYSRLKDITYVMGLHFPIFIIGRFCKKIDNNVIIDNFYIHRMGQNILFKLFLRFLLNGKHYQVIVHSYEEMNYYKKIASSLDVKYFPFCMKKIEFPDEIDDVYNLPSKYIFTGGYTNRDYKIIFKAAALKPKINFVIILSSLNSTPNDIPSNVTIFKDTNPKIFHYILYKSECIIIPLKNHVGSSGQSLALLAMQSGKPTIYSEDNTINQYFLNDNGIPYKMNDIDSLIKAIEIFNNLDYKDLSNIYKKQTENYIQYFTPEKRNEFIMEIIENTIGTISITKNY